MLIFRRRWRNSYLFILLYIIIFFMVKDSLFGAVQEFFSFIFQSEPKIELATVIPTEPPITIRNVTKRELVLLQVVFRHGHRAPFNLYPNDPHPVTFWKEGLGMLTQLGRLQHYVVGDHLQKRYKDFITTNPTEVELLSADADRCQFGGFAFVAGLYAPSENYSFTKELRWQPIISKHYPNRANRFVLSRRKCAVAAAEEHEWKAGREGEDFRNRYRPFYNFWSEHSGRNVKDWTRAADLGKTLACERDYNLSVPEWGKTYWAQLEEQAGISYYFNFRTRLIQRYRVGPLISYLRQKIEQKVNGTTPDKKVYVYSSHGSNIACLLLAIGAYNMRAPPHASTLALELWLEDDRDYSIRWLYFNSSNPEKRMDAPFVMPVAGCGEQFCPLDTFFNLTSDLIPGDYLQECNDFSIRLKFPLPDYIPESSSQRTELNVIILYIVFIVFIFLNKM
ncbi:prostatic acid phosphatase-like [Uloborus diversus]|uniref:prostatic acid phosphatase-like n=1 Tax=Uloborus diversus TaxID=327109 RepID=UPI0024096EC1|nr:prostatic acid phosphatase-like [Uloborus diversus]